MIVLLCLVLTLPLAAPPTTVPADAAAVATLTQATGDVMVRHGQAWVRVDKAPVSLWSGDTVSTDRGRAEIHFLRDDSTVILDVGTQMTITETEPGAAGKFLRRIEVFLGDVWFNMSKSANRKTDLVTPTAVGGLRGTQGLIHVENEKQSDFTLSEGQLEITHPAGTPSAGGKSTILNAGETLRAEHGQAFQPRKAATLPTRPAVDVSTEQLPKPRDNWRQLLGKEKQPPAATTQLPSASTVLHHPVGGVTPVVERPLDGKSSKKSKSHRPELHH